MAACFAEGTGHITTRFVSVASWASEVHLESYSWVVFVFPSLMNHPSPRPPFLLLTRPLHLSWSPPYASLPLPGFNLYPFTVINCNHEHKSSVCSVSSPNELSNLRVGTVPSELGSWCRGEGSRYTAPSLHSFTSKDQLIAGGNRMEA